MSTFVLVHGAWQGASTWDLIVPKLQTAGHQVFAPELTGLGEDSHRLSSSVNLDSHTDDVAGLLQRENLQGVTLVGHSYAGMVITGVAERESARLRRLIYVDAFVPKNLHSIFFPKPFKHHCRKMLMQMGKVGGCLPVKNFWICGAWDLAPHVTMLERDCVTSVCDASSRKLDCRRTPLH